MKFTVTIEKTETLHAYVDVDARDEDHAWELAEKIKDEHTQRNNLEFDTVDGNLIVEGVDVA